MTTRQHVDHVAAGRQVAHKNLKPDMQVLTRHGWRTVQNAPIPSGNKLLVRLTNGQAEIHEPDYQWVRRTNTPLT